MPTVLTHPAVPLALRYALGREAISKRLLVAGIACSVLPDLDVVAFGFGIGYGSEFGHRGFTHSLAVAAALAVLGAGAAGMLRTRAHIAFWFLFVSTASHGALDACTNGGLGIAFLWPFAPDRYFAPVEPIEVSPIGVARFLSPRGLDVLRSELVWVWLPLGLFALVAAYRYRPGRRSG